jgi:hypothetical protein
MKSLNMVLLDLHKTIAIATTGERARKAKINIDKNMVPVENGRGASACALHDVISSKDEIK